jgi:hypothetical protein
VPRPPGYHGSFEHPIRAFLLGVALIALLFGGFALGTGVSKGSSISTETSVQLRTVRHTRVERVTVALPGSTEVISGQTVVVPGPTRTRWVQVPERGPVAPVLGVIRSLMHTAGVPGGAAPPVTVVQPVTITETQTTTVPVTVTVTVTGTGTDTGSSSNQTTGS